MYELRMFDTVEELRELTGLPGDDYDKALWDAGFNLDDWDVGFQSDKPLDHVRKNAEECSEDGCDIFFGSTSDDRSTNDDAYWLVSRMEDYCVGYSYTEYKGKHYYLVHHA